MRPSTALPALALLALLAACTPAKVAPPLPAPEPTPVASLAPAATAAPAATPAPATPAPAVVPVGPDGLLVSVATCDDVCGVPSVIEYRADGIVLRDGEVGWRLDAGGLAILREALGLAAPLLAAPASEPEPIPGTEPPGHGVLGYTLAVPLDAADVQTVDFGSARSYEPEYWVVDARTLGLTDLAESLADPVASFGAHLLEVD